MQFTKPSQATVLLGFFHIEPLTFELLDCQRKIQNILQWHLKTNASKMAFKVMFTLWISLNSRTLSEAGIHAPLGAHRSVRLGAIFFYFLGAGAVLASAGSGAWIPGQRDFVPTWILNWNGFGMSVFQFQFQLEPRLDLHGDHGMVSPGMVSPDQRTSSKQLLENFCHLKNIIFSTCCWFSNNERGIQSSPAPRTSSQISIWFCCETYSLTSISGSSLAIRRVTDGRWKDSINM